MNYHTIKVSIVDQNAIKDPDNIPESHEISPTFDVSAHQVEVFKTGWPDLWDWLERLEAEHEL